MTDIIRSTDEIQQMIDAIQAAHDQLPDRNAFGGSNKREKLYMRRDIEDLEAAKRGLLVRNNDNVRYWLIGNPNSTLEDYLA